MGHGFVFWEGEMARTVRKACKLARMMLLLLLGNAPVMCRMMYLDVCVCECVRARARLSTRGVFGRIMCVYMLIDVF